MKLYKYAMPCGKSLGLAIAAITLSKANPVLAQDLMLEEVIVTAQKRAQSLQDVPISVATVSADTIQNAGINTIEDLKTLVPALNIYSTQSPALTSISLRGAGTGATDPTLEPSVGVFVDGVFMPRSIFGLSDLVDVERVEVLMGPQGTLYGKNTNAGVISVVTKGAPEGFEAQLETTAGDYGLMEGKVSLGGVMTDDLAWRVGGLIRQRDGLMDDEITGDDDYNEVDRQAWRGQLYWNPTDALSVRTIGYYSNSDTNQGDAERIFAPESMYYQYLAGVQAAVGMPAPGLDGEDYKVQGTRPNRSEVEVTGGSIQLDYQFENDLTLTSISGYQDWSMDDTYGEVDGAAIDFLHSLWGMEEQAFSQELRLTSPGGETVDWLAGFFYFDSDLKLGSKSETAFNYAFGLPGIDFPLGPFTVPLAAPGDHATWYNHNETETWSMFGQAAWNISEQTSMTLGLRYDDESKDFDMLVGAYDAAGVPWSIANLATGAYKGGAFVPLTSGNLVDDGLTIRSGDREEDNWSGMISLNHFIGDAMLYATVATGTKSGGFNGTFGATSIEDREFDTEESTNYEVGAKIEGLLDGRMRLNIAYFYTVYDDFQAATFDPVTVQRLVKNAGEQTTQGVDISTTTLVTDRLTLTASLQYLDAQYDDFKNANCHPLSGEKIVDGACILDGEELEFAPDWSGSVSAVRRTSDGSSAYLWGSAGRRGGSLPGNACWW
jgi:iron complex outermembrane receptor protein